MRHPINQGTGLSGAGTGDNQQRPLDRRGRLVLSMVELFTIVEAGGALWGGNGIFENVLFRQWGSSCKLNYLFSWNPARDQRQVLIEAEINRHQSKDPADSSAATGVAAYCES
jgi:hypothetical protein